MGRLPLALRTIIIAVVVAAVVVGVPLVLVTHEADQYFLFSPGTAPIITTSAKCTSVNGNLVLPGGTPCVRLSVPADKAHDLKGGVYMVDVEVGQSSPVQWVEWKLGLLGADLQMVPVAAYAGVTPTSELGCQDSQEMLTANQDAALAALAALGYNVEEVPLGAQLDGVLGGSPAWRAGLTCNDLITKVDGKTVQTAAQLSNDLDGLKPGTTVSLTDLPAAGGPARVVKVKLSSPSAGLRSDGFMGTAYLGVQTATRYKPELPFPVSVNAGVIGGPSAGLAFTLAMIDTMSNGKLTGGHRVAATGTITAGGSVGQVGGVQEKTVAVEHAGAQVFFVPKAEYSQAQRVADKRLKVVPVTSLAQVLDILHTRYGGDISGLTSPKKA